jgi:hypothetical protein
MNSYARKIVGTDRAFRWWSTTPLSAHQAVPGIDDEAKNSIRWAREVLSPHLGSILS